MHIDLFGKKRMKINLHMHTTVSDGAKSVNEAVKIYKDAGYDAVAITDHWKMGHSDIIDGIRIISGIECNVNCGDAQKGVYHILGINCKNELNVSGNDSPQKIIDEINRSGGIAILAHPAWSINRPNQTAQLKGIDITEIYNSVSDAHESSRPYSGYFVDTCACMGKMYSLIATDDTHYYDGSDDVKSYIMLECEENATDDEIIQAIKAEKFYSTQGPELHIRRENNKIIINCSPRKQNQFVLQYGMESRLLH